MGKERQYKSLREELYDYANGHTSFCPNFCEQHLEQAGIKITDKMLDYWNENWVGQVELYGKFTHENAGRRVASYLLNEKFCINDTRVQEKEGIEPPSRKELGDLPYSLVPYEYFYVPARSILRWMLDQGKSLKDDDWNENLVKITIAWKNK